MVPTKEDLEQRINTTLEILSAVSGLPIVSKTYEPEDLNDYPTTHDGDPENIIPGRFELVMSDGNDEYCIEMKNNLWNEGYGWDLDVNWSVKFNGQEISSNSYISMGHCSLKEGEFDKLAQSRLGSIDHALRGIEVECVEFMDFENYSLEEINGEESYFQCIYLAIMCHLKGRGKEMPLILSSKSRNIHEVMEKGKVDEVRKLIEEFLEDYKSLNPGCYIHVLAEAEEIKRVALRKQREFDPNIDLLEKDLSLKISEVEGTNNFPIYNILVVENDLHSFGLFTDQVKEVLEGDGRYGRTRLISEFNLSACIEVCKTGQIDLVLFDWQRPNYGEAAMFPDDMPVELSFPANGIRTQSINPDALTSEGYSKQEKEWKEKAERLDIRNKWISMIRLHCKNMGVETPDYQIVRKGQLDELLFVINKKLNNPELS